MTVVKFCLSFIVVVLSFFLLIVGKPLLIPLIIALFIWYLIKILTDTFRKIQFKGIPLPNIICFLSAILTIMGILGFFFSILSSEITQVVNAAPSYQIRLEHLINRGFELVGRTDVPTIRQLVSHINLSRLIPIVAASFTTMASNAGVIVLYLVFLLIEEKSFVQKISALVPNPYRQKTLRSVIYKIEIDIRKYIGIKTLTSLLTASLSFVILRLVGVDFAKFWACIIFILNYIPTFGSLVATVFPCILALVQFESIYPFILVTCGIGVVQFMIGNVIEPKIMGNTLNISPLVILLALSLWGNIWGITGMFLCVPLTVVGMIILSHFTQTRPIAIILSRDGNILSNLL